MQEIGLSVNAHLHTGYDQQLLLEAILVTVVFSASVNVNLRFCTVIISFVI